MAISKALSTDHGAVASYWKVTSAVFNTDGSYEIIVSGFFDQDARINNKLSMKTISYEVLSSDVATQFPNGFSLADAYQYLKTTGEFSFGAEDI